MEFVLIHRQLGPVPPEVMKKAIEVGKELIEDPTKYVPGGKIVASYKAIGQSMVICVWDVPSVDVLAPLMEQMNFMEWETEVIPVEQMSTFAPKAEQMLAQMTGS